MRRVLFGLVLFPVLFLALVDRAGGQSVAPNRAVHIPTRTDTSPAPMERLSAERSGRTAFRLPGGKLRVPWRVAVGASIEHGPLVTRQGIVVLVTGRGEVVGLEPDGGEAFRTPSVGATLGSGGILANGILVFPTSTGEVLGFRGKDTLFRARVTLERGGLRPDVLPLDDGGFVVASGHLLALFDAQGEVHNRAVLPEIITLPLVAAPRQVVAVAASGTMYGWTPGRDPERITAFAGPVSEVPCSDEGALYAVERGRQLMRVGLPSGRQTPFFAPSAGHLLGGAVCGPQFALLYRAVDGTYLVRVDRQGRELTRSMLDRNGAADGGAPLDGSAIVLADASGAVVAALPSGELGLVSPQGALQWMDDHPCGFPTASLNRGLFAGLAPLGEKRLIVACRNGSVLRLEPSDPG